MLAGATMGGRLAVEECFKWAMQRKVFNKRLIDQVKRKWNIVTFISHVKHIYTWKKKR